MNGYLAALDTFGAGVMVALIVGGARVTYESWLEIIDWRRPTPYIASTVMIGLVATAVRLLWLTWSEL